MQFQCTVCMKPGVMVPCEENIIKAASFFDVQLEKAIPIKKYTLNVSSPQGFESLLKEIHNTSIERILEPLPNVDVSEGSNEIVSVTEGYHIEGRDLTKDKVDLLVKDLFIDAIVETAVIKEISPPLNEEAIKIRTRAEKLGVKFKRSWEILKFHR